MFNDLLINTKFTNNLIYAIESFNLQYVNLPLKKIFIALNGEIIKAQKLNVFMRLRELRIFINIQINYIFTFNDNEIEYDSELDINIKDIIKEDNIIILKEKECNINIFIDNNDTSYSIKYLTTETLSDLRQKLEIETKYRFMRNNNLILLSQENLYKIKDILINQNDIHLKKEISLEHYFSHSDTELVKGNYILKLNNELLLNEVRNALNFNDIKNYYFLNVKGEIIPKEIENKYTIKSISSKNKNIFIVNLFHKNVPIQESKFLGMKNNLKLYKYPDIKLNIEQFQKCKSLIVIGETGSGKTTLLNCFINYLMGIRKDDDFRYIIIDEKDIKKEEESHTLNINSYFILPTNKDIPPIKIIDTPGFGDTRENLDSDIIKKFKDFLDEEISIFLICFVMKSNNNRNTEFKKYVISNILGLFGKDLISNFMILFTFCDGGVPLFIKSLTSTENPFSKIISNISDPWYISFNNSAIFADKSNLRNVFWDICYDGFSELILKLNNIEKKSLYLSKNVNTIRNEILNKARKLNKILDDCLDVQNTLDNLIIKYNEEFQKLEEYKNYKSIKTKEENKIIKTDSGIHNINCLKCQKSCHKFCKEIQNGDISKCKVIVNSICDICKCNYEKHFDQPFYYSCCDKSKERVNSKMYNNYIKIQIEIAKIDSLIDLKVKDLKKYEVEANNYVKNIQNNFENLNKISLFSNIYKIQENFIEYKIIIEKSSKKKEYLEKIAIYEKYKKTFNKLNNIFEKNNIFKEVDEFHLKFDKNRNDLSESVKDSLINTIIINKYQK